MTPELVIDNLATQVAFARAAIAYDPDARWASINANHMLPSGSSLFHPHLQGSVDPVPTTMQRLLVDTPADRFRAYLTSSATLASGISARADGCTGSRASRRWPLASCAPSCSMSPRRPSSTTTSYEELGHGIATGLNLYAELGFESFNLALYGAPPGSDGYPLNLRIACRSNLKPLYRSDATYFERLHWEAAVDISPEELAKRAGDRFRRSSSSAA